MVEQGKIITAAGVSSGIDMALVLAARIAGHEVAQAIQLGIEYDPQPPFDAGSVEKAPPEIVRADPQAWPRRGPRTAHCMVTTRVGRFTWRNGQRKAPNPGGRPG